jgi:hypothetical protein
MEAIMSVRKSETVIKINEENENKKFYSRKIYEYHRFYHINKKK